MTSFTFGSVHAATMNNVGGDQTVHGGQQVFVGTPPEIVRAAGDLLAALRRADLAPGVQAAVVGEAGALGRDLAASEADRHSVARRLSGIVTALQKAGSAVGAIVGLGAPLAAIAHWLGPLGRSVLALL